MPVTTTVTEFRTWQAGQPVRFGLVDGRPVRLPEEAQGASRVARVRQVAGRVLASEAAVTAWLEHPLAALGGLEPETLAADGEEGCQAVLRTLVAMGRLREGAGG